MVPIYFSFIIILGNKNNIAHGKLISLGKKIKLNLLKTLNIYERIWIVLLKKDSLKLANIMLIWIQFLDRKGKKDSIHYHLLNGFSKLEHFVNLGKK